MNTPCKILLIILVAIISFSSTYLFNHYTNCRASNFFYPLLQNAPFTDKKIDRHFSQPTDHSPTTNLNHLVFGLIGSENTWQHRRSYIESWWRPNATSGYLFLDKPPGPNLLPWPETSPPFRVLEVRAHRMVHAITEILREVVDHENLRWVVMGDDDSIFFVDNLVDVLAQYDHNKYYYLGGHSEFILSNYHFSFDMAFGGGGVMLSYPLAKALARDMESCVKRYDFSNFADNTTRVCVADIGANLLPQKGNHQIDLRGDISGLLQAHPQTPLISLHHFDMVHPIFPAKDRAESTRHLMTAAKADQSRMLQQTICHHKQSNWSLSISWGYSAHIYERIMPRSYLRTPVETFKPWVRTPRPPNYLFKTRKRSYDPCECPHVFFLDAVEERGDGSILTRYSRAWPRALPACSSSGNHSAESIRTIHVFSPATKRTQTDRCECCDIIDVDSVKAEIRVRECLTHEIIA